MKRLLSMLGALAALQVPAWAAPQGGTKTDPVTGEQAEGKPKEAKPAAAETKKDEPKKDEAAPAAAAPNEPQKIDPKSFDRALQSYFLGYPKDSAAPLLRYTEGIPQTAG